MGHLWRLVSPGLVRGRRRSGCAARSLRGWTSDRRRRQSCVGSADCGRRRALCRDGPARQRRADASRCWSGSAPWPRALFRERGDVRLGLWGRIHSAGCSRRSRRVRGRTGYRRGAHYHGGPSIELGGARRPDGERDGGARASRRPLAAPVHGEVPTKAAPRSDDVERRCRRLLVHYEVADEGAAVVQDEVAAAEADGARLEGPEEARLVEADRVVVRQVDEGLEDGREDVVVAPSRVRSASPVAP